MPEMFVLEHFMLATPDLAATAAEVERRTRVRLTLNGRHPGQGTCKLQLRLGAGCGLELIGPDSGCNATGNLGEQLVRLPGPAVLMFGMRACDIEGASARATTLGLWADTFNCSRRTGPIVMSRLLPARALTKWRLLVLGGNAHEPAMPFFIQWESAPSIGSVDGRALARFWVDHPKSCGLAELSAALSVTQEISVWPEVPSLKLPLNAPRGAVMF
jgi:hypothetical protein